MSWTKTENLQKIKLNNNILIKKILYQIDIGEPVLMLVNKEDIGQCILLLIYLPEGIYGFLSPISDYKLSKIYTSPLAELLNYSYLLKLDGTACLKIEESWILSIEDKVSLFKGYFPTSDFLLGEYTPLTLLQTINDLNKDYKKTTKGNWYWEERDNDTLTLFAESDFNFQFLNKTHKGHPANLINTLKTEWDFNGENNRKFIANMKNEFFNIYTKFSYLKELSQTDYKLNNVLKVLNVI